LKFIVHAQLPKALSHLLNYKGHDSIHTLDLPLNNTTPDNEIIELSVIEKRVVITKDSDFLDSFLVNSLPEKLIIVKTGNISNLMLLDIFDSNLTLIILMISRSNLIEISSSDIAEHL